MHPTSFRCGVFVALALFSITTARAQIGAGSSAGRERAAPAPNTMSSWNGKYTNLGLVLELTSPRAGAISGTLSFDGRSHPLIAIPMENKLVGTVQVGDDATSFEATRDGEILHCLIGGTSQQLRRAPDPASASRKAETATAAAPTAAAESGQLVNLNLGCSFRLPNGWTYKEENDGVVLLPAGVRFDPARPDNAEVYILAARNDYDPAEEASVVQNLSSAVGQSGGSGGQRRAAKFGSREGAVYQWDFRDPLSGRPAGLDIYLATEGTRAMIILAVGENSRIRANASTVRQMLSSIEFPPTAQANAPVVNPAPTPPPAPVPAAPAAASGPLADSTPLAQRWLAKLRGRVVRQFWASQGMSSDKRHWLNADGTYAFKSNSMVSVDVSGASALSTGRDSTTGRWRIRDVSGDIFLEVHYNDGNVRQMPITEDNRNWYLNGEKAFAVNPE